MVSESTATVLVRLARTRAELFHFGETCFATLHVGDHVETHSLRSSGFRSWLSKLLFDEHGSAASGESISSATATLEGFARFQGEDCAVFVRIAECGGEIFLDLANDGWQVVEISPVGWHVIESLECPVRFRRPHGMLSLPTPMPGGEVVELRHFLNVESDDDFLLLVSWVLGALHPRGPYPVLILHGEQGSAKTTTARILRELIDPNLASVRSEPREPRDLMIAATNSWVCAFDNLSVVHPWLSDGLCRLSTGGGFGTRALYCDDEEKIFQAKRPAILTGIEELATRGDLLDRALIVYLRRVAEKKCLPEERFFGAFNAARPRLLGALLNAASAAFKNSSKVVLDRVPRMADFAVWVTAAEQRLGWEPGSFMRAYIENRLTASELPLETPVVDALRKLALPWRGTAGALLAAIEPATDRVRHLKGWPASGRTLSNMLRRLTPSLRQVGIDVDFSREGGTGRRIIEIRKNSANLASPASQAPRDGLTTDFCDASDALNPGSAWRMGDLRQRDELAESLICPSCGNREQNLAAARYHRLKFCGPFRGLPA